MIIIVITVGPTTLLQLRTPLYWVLIARVNRRAGSQTGQVSLGTLPPETGLIIRIGFWAILYLDDNKEPPK